MILVIGGRSKIGGALVDELVARDQQVRALSRATESTKFPDGVEAVPGDLADIGSLTAAMGGVEKVFLLCGPAENEYRLNCNAVDAAESSGVRLLVRSSILGSSPDSLATFPRDHGEADQHLRDSGVEHVIVRPNLFLQNITETTIPSIDAEGRFYANAGDAKISMVDTRDVAAVAAVALTEPGHEGSEYNVTGPEALSYGDVAAAISEHLGRNITYVPADDDATRNALLGYGLGDWFAGALVGLYQDYRRSGVDGYAAEVTDTVERLTGRPARSLEGLLAEQPDPARA